MPEDVALNLETEISVARRSIASDGYPMSIGELTNLYREGELLIRPEFQRFFRWSEIQKSRLIESLLLGIPLPSIFVAQTDAGTWELVDGLQRISTILQLQGELIGADGTKIEALVLRGTKYLPALEARRWQDPNPSFSLSEAQRLDIKRSKIDIKIIKRESSPETKFDLFQRLNSYGSPLTAQEMRSALLVAASPDFFSWLEALAAYPNFINSTLLSDRLIDERYDIELVIRFIVLHSRPLEKLSIGALRDFSQVLDDESIALAEKYPSGVLELERIFKSTFDTIAANGADEVFRRWDNERQEFRGSFLNTAFEVFGLGIGYHIANATRCRTDLLALARTFWARPEMQSGYATGRSTEARLTQFVPLGRQITAAP